MFARRSSWPSNDGATASVRRPEYYKANPCASILDIAKAREVLGFRPTSDWRTMVASLREDGPQQ